MKYRFFQHLLGGEDTGASDIYCWHIKERSGARMAAGFATDQWKRTTDDYISSAKALALSMQDHGYDERYPIPIDADGELLGGAHRLACAIALGIERVPVEPHANKKVWAPAWGLEWFTNVGVPKEVLRRILADWLDMNSDI